MSVIEVCRDAAAAWSAVKRLTTARKDAVLLDMARAIEEHRDAITAANQADVAAAREAGISATLCDRLTLTPKRMAGLTGAIRTIADLPDPVGAVVEGWTRPNGLLIERVREPLGVVAVIYEARPNVTAEVAALCLKSGNCAVLRGSSMAMATNRAIMAALAAAIAKHPHVPAAAVQLIDDPAREAALELMRAKGYVDLLVPRGGPALIATVEQHATVPTVIDGAGNCHVYVDAAADPDLATAVAVNAKTSRPSVCNAMETLLVHQDVAATWLPGALDALAAEGVEIRGDERVCELWPKASPAMPADWATEYLDLILAVRVVPDLEAALAHLREYGTSNADAIVTRDLDVARRFVREVDTGSVFVNTSTRYSDGGEYGYGVEIGVSTQKLHVRGPMGLTALTTVKNVVWGSGQTRTV
jgi:glutamate-5-semialdehyde dehydrogenase